MRKIRLLGLNHATAPLAVREKLAFSPGEIDAALARLAADHPGGEFVLLSTCNRVELYHAADEPLHGESLAAALAGLKGLRPSALAEATYEHAGRAAAEHLFRVASALGSMVLGETQILGQVGRAYAAATAAGCCGRRLHPLFQRAQAVAKQVQRETDLGTGRVSVASVAVDYARQIFDDLPGRTVLMVGAGEMGELVLRAFAAERAGRLLVANRSPAKAAALAEDVGGEAVPWAELPGALVRADVALCSTGASQPVVTAGGLRPLLAARRYRPLFLIDLAVPRDVEPAAGELENVYRYDLDDLQRVVSKTVSRRTAAVEQAEAIVAAHVEQFTAWNRQRELGPTIDALYRRQHALASDELEKTLAAMPHLSDADRRRLREGTRRLVNRLMHAPVRALRDRGHTGGDAHGPNVYQHALTELFQLAGTSGDEDAAEKRHLKNHR